MLETKPQQSQISRGKAGFVLPELPGQGFGSLQRVTLQQSDIPDISALSRRESFPSSFPCPAPWQQRALGGLQSEIPVLGPGFPEWNVIPERFTGESVTGNRGVEARDGGGCGSWGSYLMFSECIAVLQLLRCQRGWRSSSVGILESTNEEDTGYNNRQWGKESVR